MVSTTPEIDASAEAQDLFRRLFEGRNWMLLLPPLATVGVALAIALPLFVLAAVMVAFGAGLSSEKMGTHDVPAVVVALGPATAILLGALAFLASMLWLFVVSTLGHAWTLAAGEPVLRGQPADLAGGFARALSKFGPLFIAGVLIGLGAFVLLPTIVGWFVWLFFCVYAAPAILFGNESGVGGISRSFHLVRDNLVPTLLLLLLLVVIAVAAALCNFAINLVPFIGFLVALPLSGLQSAYSALAVARWYYIVTGTSPPLRPVLPAITS